MNAMTNEREAPGPIYVLINQHGVLMEDRSFSDASEAARMAEAYTDFEDRFQAVEVAPVVRESVAPSAEPAKPVEAVDERKAFENSCRTRGLSFTRNEGKGDDYSGPHIQAMWDGWCDRAALAHPRPTGDEAFIIKYEDADEPDEVFYGHGARSAAFRRYAQRSAAWSANLFQRIDCNTARGDVASPTVEQAGGATCERCGATSDKDAERRCIPDGDSCPGCEEPLNSAWQAGEVVAWQYRSPAQVEFGRKPTLTEDAELVRLMREAGDHEIVELVAVDAAQPRAYGVPDGKAVAFRIVGRNGPYRWIDVSLIEKDNPPEAVIGDGERVEYAYAQPRPSTTEDSSAVAQPRPVGVPDGWKLVPREPDAKMFKACDTVIQGYGAKLVWQRMYDDAPAPDNGGEA